MQSQKSIAELCGGKDNFHEGDYGQEKKQKFTKFHSSTNLISRKVWPIDPPQIRYPHHCPWRCSKLLLLQIESILCNYYYIDVHVFSFFSVRLRLARNRFIFYFLEPCLFVLPSLSAVHYWVMLLLLFLFSFQFFIFSFLWVNQLIEIVLYTIICSLRIVDFFFFWLLRNFIFFSFLPLLFFSSILFIR